jgi:D-alanyl-D-alanine dipeptidase
VPSLIVSPQTPSIDTINKINLRSTHLTGLLPLMKEYRQVPIVECGEPLVAIPEDIFAREIPHPYVKCGAEYGGKSPYYLRSSVLDKLIQAQGYLQQLHPDWRIQIFDAYRPVEVQQYMVDYTFQQTIEGRGLNLSTLSESQIEEIWQDVYQIWAIPSFDPATPPPHSTGAAIDITLVDGNGIAVNMGSPIDEMSPRSQPNYFANALDPEFHAYHHHRQILLQVMNQAGFLRHPGEWWHFSNGDQLWAWLSNRDDPQHPVTAYYGRVIY